MLNVNIPAIFKKNGPEAADALRQIVHRIGRFENQLAPRLLVNDALELWVRSSPPPHPVSDLVIGVWLYNPSGSQWTVAFSTRNAAGVREWTAPFALVSATSVTTGTLVAGTSVATADEAYDATTWNANLTVPTKNAVRDKIEALAGLVGLPYSRGTSLPSVPSSPALAWLNRQAGSTPNRGDALYVSMQLDSGSWDWVLLQKAP